LQETATELLQDRVVAEARQWAARHAGQEANPYEFFLGFLKKRPPESWFGP
jgi:hypothetical protein